MERRIIQNHNMSVIKQRTEHLRKPSVEGNLIATASKKHRRRQTSFQACSNQRRASIAIACHFRFNTDAFRSISILTETCFTETRLVNINRLFATDDGFFLKCQEIDLTFYGTLFFVGLRLFFRVMFNVFSPYQIQCLETPKWAARSF